MYYPSNQVNENQSPYQTGYNLNDCNDSSRISPNLNYYNMLYQNNWSYYQGYKNTSYNYYSPCNSASYSTDYSSPESSESSPAYTSYNYSYYDKEPADIHLALETSQIVSQKNVELPEIYSSYAVSNAALDTIPNGDSCYETPMRTKSSKACRNSRKQLLPDIAVDIMNDWFEDHFNNPYPTLEEKEKMAKQAGITVKQVNAWFSNRRNRSQNTKPKRIKRAIEQEINHLFSEISYVQNGTQLLEKFKKTLLSQ
ncbi:unnamed protein product [Brachionus calyciflorus]|uniref:Homeobox domain-containing protein n=1 Tax=Brachionus calyciflorus TaxID=104777 RepID=A0A813MKL7_9BILA|nr:unnamed protein product [Brachionus calyciflorus]